MKLSYVNMYECINSYEILKSSSNQVVVYFHFVDLLQKKKKKRRKRGNKRPVGVIERLIKSYFFLYVLMNIYLSVK